MPAPRFNATAGLSLGQTTGSVPLAGWVDLVGDPDGSSDGLVVTLAIEPRSARAARATTRFPVTSAAAVQAAFVDCRSEIIRRLPASASQAAALVIDSGIRPPHVERDRATRRAECLEAARALGKQSLRDVDDTLWRRWHDELPTVLLKRAVHVREENARAVALTAALEQGDWAEVGRLMTESQRSLVSNYEIRCAEIDALLSVMAGVAGVFGCRRAGGGFGGQVVAAVDSHRIDSIVAEIAQGYGADTGRLPAGCLVAVITAGVG